MAAHRRHSAGLAEELKCTRRAKSRTQAQRSCKSKSSPRKFVDAAQASSGFRAGTPLGYGLRGFRKRISSACVGVARATSHQTQGKSHVTFAAKITRFASAVKPPYPPNVQLAGAQAQNAASSKKAPCARCANSRVVAAQQSVFILKRRFHPAPCRRPPSRQRCRG